jgi:hypothetical protein
MRKPILYVLLGCGLMVNLLNGCNKTDTPSGPDFNLTVTTSVSGRVLNEKNEPVSGAVVNAGAASTTTDINGIFSFNNVSLSEQAAYVKVTKSGYFLGSRTFTATANSNHYVGIKLIPQTLIGSFSANAGATVTIPGGASINFPANGIVSALNNTPYTGLVGVQAYFLDPNAADFRSIMPGELRGITQSNQERGLQSFGMIAVQLVGGASEALQLAPGKTAFITMNIPTALAASAPATIPLWYFDEQQGLWKEEGVATKTGNTYSGQVSHFSFWNCDAPFPVTDFQAIFKDQNNNALARYRVELKTIGDTVSIFGNGYTDATGRVSGKIPTGKALRMNVYNTCQNLVLTQNIGPFSAPVNLGTITINTTAQVSFTLSGTAVNCNNQPITNGYAQAIIDQILYRANINNGSFSIPITRCVSTPSTASVKVVDLGAIQEGSPVTIPVTTSNVNAGQLSGCGINISQFLQYTLNGQNYAITAPNDSLMSFRQSTTTAISGMSRPGTSSAQFVDFQFTGATAPGTYPVNSIRVSLAGQLYSLNGTMNTVVTEYGANNNGFIAGTLSGTLKRDSSNPIVTVPFSASYRVRRNF